MDGSGREQRTCPACGEAIDRREAREYDKDATPWSLRGTPTEFLCPGCFADLDHSPREGLEARLIDIGAGRCDRATFLERYLSAGRGRQGTRSDRS